MKTNLSTERIFANLPSSLEWPTSFLGRLVEDCIWDKEQFWRLHLALLTVAESAQASSVLDRELSLAVMRLQARVLGALSAHYCSDDLFKISNLADRELRDYAERFEHATLSVFSGEILPESSYDLQNPLRIET
jgi:hypothetical protein